MWRIRMRRDDFGYADGACKWGRQPREQGTPVQAGNARGVQAKAYELKLVFSMALRVAHQPDARGSIDG